MTPLLFGPASRQLFGLFHPAQGGAANAPAVLICPPFGQEAIRSHRFFRVLAERLARSGTPVLRFDYFGTGDSPGDDLDGEFEGWRVDVCTAHEALRRLVSDRRIVWLGARLGATLAVLAARSGRCDPARLLLWDPILAGGAYLDLLRERHVHALELSFCIPDRAWRRQLGTNPDAFAGEAMGFAMSETLLRQLRALRPDAVQLTALHETQVLAPDSDAAVARWCGDEAARNKPVQLAAFKHALDWASELDHDRAMVPAEAIQRLTSALNSALA